MSEPLSIINALKQPISLKTKAAEATAWTFGSFGISQILRVLCHLLLYRLLSPEIFGLMLIVDIMFHAMAMFSDFGISPGIIQNPKGGNIEYLRTAWTIRILMSIAQWIIATILAFPMAYFLDEPMLLLLIPVVAFSGVIDGFTSAQVDALERELELKRVVILDLGSYILSLAVMIGAAWYWRNVWALVAGGMTYSLVSTVLTHIVLGGEPMRFELNKKVMGEMFHFGKWLFISSILTFLTESLDDIVLTQFMSLAELGMYGLALSLAFYIPGITSEFSKTILFPKFSRAQEVGEIQLRNMVLKSRLMVMVVFLPPLWLQCIFAEDIVGFLYDSRYAGAAWMLQLLTIGAIFMTMMSPLDHLLLAAGNTYLHMKLEFIYMMVLIPAIFVGGYFWGAPGIIGGSIATSFLIYPYLVSIHREYGIWMPVLDFGGMAVSAGMICLGLWLHQ